ncbi:hypothetical protein KXW82_008332, partial [Aspergillus fumigatus]
RRARARLRRWRVGVRQHGEGLPRRPGAHLRHGVGRHVAGQPGSRARRLEGSRPEVGHQEEGLARGRDGQAHLAREQSGDRAVLVRPRRGGDQRGGEPRPEVQGGRVHHVQHDRLVPPLQAAEWPFDLLSVSACRVEADPVGQVEAHADLQGERQLHPQ